MLFILLALAVPFALAACPNECSGHGSCNEYAACLCHRNWMGNDCSQRVCYFDRAFIDTPTGDMNADGSLNPLKAVQVLSQNQLISELFPTEDFALGKSAPATAPNPTNPIATSAWAKWSEAHFYAECSGKGVCQRESGQCACFAGYEGEGCTRLSCPTTTEASCSGHGTCHLFADSYQAWDSKRTQFCKCDAGFTGVACAERECPFGDDPVTKYVYETKICAGAALGSGTQDPTANSATLTDLVGKVVYGSKTGAKGTIRKFSDTSLCVHVINEEFAMFSKEEDLYVQSGSELITLAKYEKAPNTTGPDTKITSIYRDYLDDATSAVVQQNAEQLIKIKKTASDNDTIQVDFSLQYVDEFGQSYNTESTLCKWGNAADRTECVANVETALERLPHNTTGNLRLEDATETRGECWGIDGTLQTNLTTRKACNESGACSNPLITTESECLKNAPWCAASNGTNLKFRTDQTACYAGGNPDSNTWETSNEWTSSNYIWNTTEDMAISVYFYDNSGPQQLLTAFGSRSSATGVLGNLVVNASATSDATIKVETSTAGLTELASCSNRGLCDYSVGLCKCFPGFTGDDCSQQNVLAMH